MILTGPAPVTIVPATAVLVVNQVAFDMNAKTYTISYGDPGNVTAGVVTGAIPAGVYTQLQALAAKAVEAKVGWVQGSSVAT